LVSGIIDYETAALVAGGVELIVELDRFIVSYHILHVRVK